MSRVQVRERMLCGIRVKFIHDTRKLEIVVEPNAEDIRTVPVQTLLRFWVTVSGWASGVSQSNPGWRVRGVDPKKGQGSNV